MKTSEKVTFLQKHVKGRFMRIKKKHSDNITGFRISRKVTGGKLKQEYSIVIQVVKKEDLNVLDNKQIIPKELKFTFPDGVSRMVKTDVQETGEFKLQNGIGAEVRSSFSPGEFGTAGLFVSDNGSRALMITNYHVAGRSLIQKGIMYYDRPSGNNIQNIRMKTLNGDVISGCLDEGCIDSTIDIAFVELIATANHNMNMLANGRKVQGRVADNPIPGSFEGRGVHVFSNSQPEGIPTVVNNVSASVGNATVHFDGLLQMTKVTLEGDSGSVVLTSSYSAVGIIVGADDKYSYAIPFYQIDNFRSFSIL